MRRDELRNLESTLLDSGMSPQLARRTLEELGAHFDDIVDAALADGAKRAVAERQAAECLGTVDDYLATVRARPELRGWAFRYPRVAACVYPLACLAVLPAVPVLAGMQHRQELARWSLCLVAGATVTAAIFLALQLAILFS